MITIENIYKSYKNISVLKNINFQINKKEIVSLYGSSGSGKTTLLNIIGTLDIADNGFMRIGELERFFSDSIFTKVNKFHRLINFLIDSIAITIISWLISLFLVILSLWVESQTLSELHVPTFSIWILIYSFIPLQFLLFVANYAYYGLLEYKYHTTLGKLCTGTFVITKDGLFPSSDTILARTIFRSIIFEPLSLLFSSKKRGWHDSWSRTIVIDKAKNIEFLNNLNSRKFKTEDDLCSFRNTTIGFVFQNHCLFPDFSALENVCIPGYIKGVSKLEVEIRGKELLSILGLEDKFDKRPNELSGGEQQRIAVARALINNPQIVLADEPAGNLDSVNAEALHKTFIKLRDKYDITFLIATHDRKLAEISDTILTIKDGEIYSKRNINNRETDKKQDTNF